MESEEDKNRLEKLMEGMEELMSGNFSVQISKSEKDDQLEALIAQFNMLAQKLGNYFSKNAFYKPEHSSLFATILILDLDEEFKVVGASKAVKSVLNWDFKDIENQSVTQVLREDSLPHWERMVADIIDPETERASKKLWFKTAQDLTVPAYCFISEKEDAASSKIKYSLHAFESFVLEKVYDKFFPMDKDESPYKIESELGETILSPSDLGTMKEVHKFVHSKIKEKLPSLKDIATKFYINEDKLKRNFKMSYGSTPHSLHKEIRLEQSHYLLTETDKPISTIADDYFSKNSSNFSHAIKKKYGMSPTEVRNNKPKEKGTKKKETKKKIK